MALRSGLRRRAAFDIGSGMSKMQVSDVDVATGRVVSTLFAEERSVLFAADWKGSGERSELSDEIQREGLEVLGALREIARQHEATELRAVATEVFRKAVSAPFPTPTPSGLTSRWPGGDSGTAATTWRW